MLASLVTAAVLCNNFNYSYSPDCTPVEFHQTYKGFEGTLANGAPFTQEWITREVMLFKGQDMKWLVYKDQVVYLNN